MFLPFKFSPVASITSTLRLELHTFDIDKEELSSLLRCGTYVAVDHDDRICGFSPSDETRVTGYLQSASGSIPTFPHLCLLSSNPL